MKNFKPTPAMISAAETLFTTMAFLGTVQPVVLKYQTEILAEGRWRICPELAPHMTHKDPVILDPKDSYMMSNDDFAVYNAKCKEARDKAKLHVDNDDHCPLLVAEDMVRMAKRALIEAMFDVLKVSPDRLLSAGMDKYEKAVELCLQLLAPSVRNADELLKQYKPTGGR